MPLDIRKGNASEQVRAELTHFSKQKSIEQAVKSKEAAGTVCLVCLSFLIAILMQSKLGFNKYLIDKLNCHNGNAILLIFVLSTI